ncbi:hypothetical protein M493_11880 [Geobacillus genomosp. 3]|uniref:Uncharacterized protein n=1 Tax=Geobacillus genomosp. 3 TaxID=1921421 RepID=S5Z0U4_GEOG3|nr:hypothetical protein M493_11880 [Geobacillus genomosp. 3]
MENFLGKEWAFLGPFFSIFMKLVVNGGKLHDLFFSQTN